MTTTLAPLSAVVTASSFPTPALALRGGVDTDRVRAFSQHQAAAADMLRAQLACWWPGLPLPDRAAVLRQAYDEVVRWRYQLALKAPGRLGHGLPLDAERFRLSIRDGSANYDRLGHIGRLRDGARWDSATRGYQGGEETPASAIMETFGLAAHARFRAEQVDGDTLTNTVTLPNGRRVTGNRLVRGTAARQISADLTARIAARGGDTSRIDIGTDPIYAVTADPDNADIIHAAALDLLAGAVDLPHEDRTRAWQDARYLLFQSPRTKKGSDASVRVFLVAVGAVLFDAAPELEQDCDLRCMVLGQEAATMMPADAVLHRTP